MKPYYEDDRVTLWHGDCLDVLRELPDASVDSVVTDPPYGLEFMGREWDGADGFRRSLNPADAGRDNAFGRSSRTSPEYRAGSVFQEWCEAWATECLRVLKPGGHLLAFGGTRTWHRLACAVEDAGFEIRDSIAWMYGSGFPKSLDVSKAIDKAAGAERHDVYADDEQVTTNEVYGKGLGVALVQRNPATDAARTWQGWGTALKPAHEPIVVARKPLTGTVAANVLAYGTGALNIDGCRVETDDVLTGSGSPPLKHGGDNHRPFHDTATPRGVTQNPAGRWPANVVLDESQADALDQQSGTLTSGKMQPTQHTTAGVDGRASAYGADAAGGFTTMETYGDSGGASRFFYVAKADASERIRLPKAGAGEGRVTGLDGKKRRCRTCGSQAPQLDKQCGHDDYEWVPAPDRGDTVAHPTVKPLALMRWLVRLVTPPGGVVLEPFAGSGTTVEACILEGLRCIAIEREADYLPLIIQRINRRRDPVAAVLAQGDDAGLFDLLDGEGA